jgi:hemolysin-activating ACP:hemolysin acyltransferase
MGHIESIEALNPNIEATIELLPDGQTNQVKVLRFGDADGYCGWAIVKEHVEAEKAIAEAMAETTERLEYEATLTE